MGDKLSLRRVFGLLALYARMDLDWLLRDAKLSLLDAANGLIACLSSLSGVFLLAWRFGGVGGLSPWQILFMLGFTATVAGLCMVFFGSNNVAHISRRIGRGQLDHMLLQPLPLWLQLIAEGFLPFSGCPRLLVGLGLVLWSLRGLELSPGWFWWLSLAGYLACAVLCLVGLSYLWSALAFRWPVAFEEISSVVIDEICGPLSQYPLSILPPALLWPLVSILPAGLLAWFPSCILLGRPPLGLPELYPLFFTLGLWALAIFTFRKGLLYYVHYGSNRYTQGGHRN
ncbi:MAG: ABC transporter permease [Christensenellaceae bacterium]|jgi:ABC-2 type transport system permease protein|nr:ABC transporter permease [Christensenellaceae bacterium]